MSPPVPARHLYTVQLIASCKICRASVVRAGGLGNRAAHSMLAHLRDRHPEQALGIPARIADVLRRFDVYRDEPAVDAAG